VSNPSFSTGIRDRQDRLTRLRSTSKWKRLILIVIRERRK
jgi:hypothetical protein